jgi:CheY-like chemotaxis protein
MSDTTRLPSFQHIDTQLGLKYLNGNKKLYLKVLKSFLDRFKDFKIEALNEQELKDALHSIKGLSSTLGMRSVSRLVKIIRDGSETEKLSKFSKALVLVIDELQTELKIEKPPTLLIIDDREEDIDILVETLGDEYDVIVTPNQECIEESLSTEEVSLALLSTNLIDSDTFQIYDTLKQQNILILFLAEEADKQSLSTISTIKNSIYLTRPPTREKIKKHIKELYKLNSV